MLTLVTALAVCTYAVWLPGALLTGLALPDAEPFKRAVVSLALGLFLMPVFAFGAALVLRTIVSLPLVFAVATAANLGLGAALAARRRRQRRTAT